MPPPDGDGKGADPPPSTTLAPPTTPPAKDGEGGDQEEPTTTTEKKEDEKDGETTAKGETLFYRYTPTKPFLAKKKILILFGKIILAPT